MLPYYFLAVSVPILFAISQIPVGAMATRHRASPLFPIELTALGTVILFSGTRVGIGTDYFLYEGIFSRVDPGDWSGTIQSIPQESGFVLLQLAVKALGGDFSVLVFLCSTITGLAVWGSLRIMDVQLAPAFLVYLCTASFLNSMNTMRQGIASALVLLAVALFPRSRPLAFVVGGVACLIHTSAIIPVLAIVALRRLKPGLLGMIVCAGIGLSGAVIVGAVPGLANFIGQLSARYADYLTTGKTAGFGTYLMAVCYLLVAVILSRASVSTAEHAWWRNCVMLAPGLVLLGTTIPIANRLSDYFTILLIPLISAAIKEAQNRSAWLVVTVVVSFAYLTAYILNYSGLVPYVSWLFGEF